MQPDLFSAAPPRAPFPDGIPLDVGTLFEKFALELVRSGRKRYSARAIIHRIRWHYHVERGIDFKVNDHCSTPLARWFHETYPQHNGFFETRERREENE